MTVPVVVKPQVLRDDAAVRERVESGQQIALSELIGGGYDGFWTTRAFFRVIKGSKGSKKSYTTAMWYIIHMMQYPDANLLVIRRVRDTLRDSVFASLQWAINHLCVQDLWESTMSPLQMRFKPTGQLILFKGMDKAEKLMSLTVPHGCLCWMWIEEAYEITNEDEFEKLQMSIRGIVPEGLWKQITLTFNPWSECWLKTRFFDNPPDNAFVDTTTYRCNEWLAPEDLKRYTDLYTTNPRNARVICDGEWGVSEGLVYTDWEVKEFSKFQVLKDPEVRTSCGLDFGFAVSFNAFVSIGVNLKRRIVWIFDEIYERGETNLELVKHIIDKGYGKETIYADAAAALSIYEIATGYDELQVDEWGEPILDDLGNKQVFHYSLPGITKAYKGPVDDTIRDMQNYHIIIHPDCINFIREINSYCYAQDRDGRFTGKPIKDNDHCLVAGTMIWTDHGDIPIEDVKVGDMVMTHLGWKPVTASGITRFDTPTVRVTFDDGTIIECTGDHPFPTDAGIVRAENMLGLIAIGVEGDAASVRAQNTVLDRELDDARNCDTRRRFVSDKLENGHGRRVVSICRHAMRQCVYDLTVEDAHDFYANSILTINCMDATRYALAKYYVRGGGRVIEAAGDESNTPRPARRCRRVASTL